MITRLKELREKTRYTEKEVSERTGIPLATYHQLEKRPIRKTNIHIYLKLAEFYGIGLDYLLGVNTTPTFDTDIINYQTIREIQRLKELNFNETEDEENLMLQTVDTKVLHKIMDKKAIEFKEYPFNLLRDIYRLSKFTADRFDKTLVPTIVEDLEKVIDTYLTEQEKYIVNLKYLRGFTYIEIGKFLNLSKERIRQITNRSMRKLNRRYILNNFVYNIDKDIEQKRVELEKLKTEIEEYDKKMKERFIDNKKEETPKISKLNLSVRTYNMLSRKGIDTVEQLIKHTLSSEVLRIKNLGKGTYFEILRALKEVKLITYDESLTETQEVAKTIRLIRKTPLVIFRDK